MESWKDKIEFLKQNKGKVVTVVAAVFSLAAGMGSTLLTPEQREGILDAIPNWIALIVAIFG